MIEECRKVGVGPWKGELPSEEFYDCSLLKNGDRRNVIDKYRYWRHESIVNDLDMCRHNFHIAIENWKHDLNIGTVVRTANAFLAKEIHIVGKKRWNRRGALVTDRYQHIKNYSTVTEFMQWANIEKIDVIGIDNFPDTIAIEKYRLPNKCVLVFGQEREGLSKEMYEACKTTLSITQFGSTRSINAAAAASIAMHTWIRQHIFEQKL